MQTRSSGVLIERHDRHVRADGLDDVCVNLLVAGRAHHEQGTCGAILEAGDPDFTALDRPFVSGLPGAYEEIRLHFPRAVFGSHLGSVGRVAGRMIRGSSPLSEPLASDLRSFAGSIERLPRGSSPPTGAHPPGDRGRGGTSRAYGAALMFGGPRCWRKSGLPRLTPALRRIP